VVVWFYFLYTGCCSVAVRICETKCFGEGWCEEVSRLRLRSGIDYDYAHEHDWGREESFAFGFGRGSITSYDYDDDYGVRLER